MADRETSNAEKAMAANAHSRSQQGAASDKARHKAAHRSAIADPPKSTDLTGPGGDPAEGKR